jgi:hypothetical protein
MLRYRLHPPDGDDLGEATYAQMIHAGEEIIAGSNEHFRVLDVVTRDAGQSIGARSLGWAGVPE